MADKPKRIFVKSTLPVRRDGGSPVAFTESHSDHPGGEAFVAGRKPVEVAETDAVLVALRDGRLERTEAPAAQKQAAAASKQTADPDALPKTTPGYSSLAAAGITTRSAVASLTDDELSQVKGLDRETVAAIRKQIPAAK
jgi:hypothetical protein